MTDYLLVYEGGDPQWMKNWSQDKQRSVMEEWNAWFKQLESSGTLRNPGAALTPGGAVVSKNGDALVTDTSLPEAKELIGGYSVIQAGSLEEATEIAKAAHKNGTTLKEEAIALGFVDEATFDAVVRPEQMIGPKD